MSVGSLVRVQAKDDVLRHLWGHIGPVLQSSDGLVRVLLNGTVMIFLAPDMALESAV